MAQKRKRGRGGLSRDQRKRLALVRYGAPRALRYTGSRDLYLCPLCGTAFPESVLEPHDPVLTLEDAPPQSVGGKPIALTCKRCNNTAGHAIDVAVSRHKDMMRFIDALIRPDINALIKPDEDSLSERAALKIGSEHVNIALVRERNSPVRRLEILGDSNDPQKVARAYVYMQEHGRETTWTGGPFVATPLAQYDERLVRVSELRAAFIVAFAAFGYRYAFDPRLTLVRQQILHPGDQVIDGWGGEVAQAGPASFARDRAPTSGARQAWHGRCPLALAQQSPKLL